MEKQTTFEAGHDDLDCQAIPAEAHEATRQFFLRLERVIAHLGAVIARARVGFRASAQDRALQGRAEEVSLLSSEHFMDLSACDFWKAERMYLEAREIYERDCPERRGASR